MQVAGADQWGNSISGVHLLRRIEGVEAHVFTAPLIVNKQTGVKFGKSEGGAIWLDPTKTSPYKFYQFWLNVDDETAEDLIKIYTLLHRDEVNALVSRHRENPAQRELQKTLAQEVTRLVHGAERTDSVRNVTEVLFGGRPFDELSSADIDELASEIPTSNSEDVTNALIEAGLAGGTGDARRLITAGAISVNGQKIESDTSLSKPSLIKKGKNGFVLVQ
jgi:tyrosyl-tRNA synthetase